MRSLSRIGLTHIGSLFSFFGHQLCVCRKKKLNCCYLSFISQNALVYAQIDTKTARFCMCMCTSTMYDEKFASSNRYWVNFNNIYISAHYQISWLKIEAKMNEKKTWPKAFDLAQLQAHSFIYFGLSAKLAAQLINLFYAYAQHQILYQRQ